jgi:hypothetical protein
VFAFPKAEATQAGPAVALQRAWHCDKCAVVLNSSGDQAGPARWSHICALDTVTQCGRLACVNFAHNIDCPWEIGTCLLAIAADSVECLKYAHTNDCP